MNSIVKKDRDSNIELLRIVLMLMIVLTHLIAHGVYNFSGIFEDGSLATNKVGYFFLSLIDYHVACFFFISGYFGIKVNLSRVVNILLKVFVYGVITYFAAGLLRYGLEWRNYIGPVALEKTSPFAFAGLWFMKSYFFLMLAAPFVNDAVERMGRNFFAGLIIIYAVALYFSGIDAHGFEAALLIYLVGRFLKKYPIEIIEKNALWFFFGAVALMFVNVAIHIYLLKDGNIRLSTENSSPLIILAAVSFFFLFKKIKINNIGAVNWLAGGVLGVYMLTDGYLRWSFIRMIIGWCGENYLLLALSAVLTTIVLAAICRCFEYLLKSIECLLVCWTRKLLDIIVKK